MASTIFTANVNTIFEENKREWHMVFSTYNQICSMLSIMLAILFYVISPTEISLTIIIAVLSVTQFISVYFLNKSDAVQVENKGENPT